MDILMIGQSNAGKTSYVSAMYDAMSSGAGEFTVRAERAADHQRLRRNAQQMRRGVFPAASDRRRVYNLQLWHAGDRIFDFVWRDYRGGALTEQSDSPQAMQLRADMANAGGLVLMIDSTDLLGGPRARSRVRPLVSTAIRLLSARQDIMPVVVALTKWDLVLTREDETTTAATELLGGLVEAVAGTGHLHGAMVAVACGAQPINVVLPVLWCLHIGIAVRGAALLQSIDYHSRIAEAAGRRRWGNLVRKMRGQPTSTDIQLLSQLQVQYDLQRIQPLIVPSQRLESLFQPVFTF